MTSVEKINYNEWTASMRERGFNHLRNDDFSTYKASLDQGIQDLVLKNNEGGYTDADKELQAKVGSIFESNGTNQLDDDALVSTLNANGFEVTKEWHNGVSHTVDNLSGTSEAGTVKTDGIYVITVKDPQTGAEIRIADTNGNGAIELEEVFFNEILAGVASNVDASNLNMVTSFNPAMQAAAGNGGGDSGGGSAGAGAEFQKEELLPDNHIENNEINQRLNGGKTPVTQRDFEIIKEKIKKEYSKKYSAELLNIKVASFMEAFRISDDAKSVNISEIVKAA